MPQDFIPISLPDVSGNEKKYLTECIDTGWISSIGTFVYRFEEAFAAFCRQSYGVSVNSGTAALHLALKALGVQAGDEIIIPSLTFASTINAVLYTGATPVIADCEENCWNIDPDQIQALITPRTKAVIPVHLYGLPCDMQSIAEIADRHGLFIIEDAAEAHGATYAGSPVGSFGHIACFSFYGNKIISTGEGGACVTSDPALYEHMCLLRDHGMQKEKRYWHTTVGYNYRLTNLQAAVGCAQLERVADFIAKRRWVKETYNALLSGLSCTLPDDRPPAQSVYWLYTLLLPQTTQEAERDELIAYLADNRIESRPFFYPIPAMPPYHQYARPLLHSKSMSRRGITLPSHYALGENDIARICQNIRNWLRKSSDENCLYCDRPQQQQNRGYLQSRD